MIHLIFILFLLSGFIQEITTTLQKDTHKLFTWTHSLTHLFFIFWQESFIVYGIIMAIMLLSITTSVCRYELKESRPEGVSTTLMKLWVFLDPYFSLVCLMGLSFHYFVWWFK
jgi:hypothetical protein